MNDNLPIPRMAQRVRSWAQLASDRAADPGADNEHWQSVAGRLDHASQAYEGGHDDRAAGIVDGVIGDLIRDAGHDHDALSAALDEGEAVDELLAERTRIREQLGWLAAAVKLTVEQPLDAGNGNDPTAYERYAAMAGSLCDVIEEKAEQLQHVDGQLRERAS